MCLLIFIISVNQLDRILSALAVWVQPISLHYVWRPQLRDPGDEMVLEAAVNGQVSAIVTHNIRDFEAVAPKFGVQVQTPAQALLKLERRR